MRAHSHFGKYTGSASAISSRYNPLLMDGRHTRNNIAGYRQLETAQKEPALLYELRTKPFAHHSETALDDTPDTAIDDVGKVGILCPRRSGDFPS